MRTTTVLNLKRWILVVPTVRPELFKKFVEAWESQFKQYLSRIIVCEDAPKKSTGVAETLKKLGVPHTHICQKDVPKWIPIQTDMIRSWGFYLAWKDSIGEDYVLTLDDDVLPSDALWSMLYDPDIFAAYEKVFEEGAPLSEYFDVGSLTSSGLQMRGFPYKDRLKRTVSVQYGGWDGVLDYDAATQLSSPKEDERFKRIVVPVPKGAAATCCIMNTAWRIGVTPIMWQLPMLKGRYNRIGDIWSGLFIKKTLDAVGEVMVINGKATVEHRRASNPYNSLLKEAPSVLMNDHLWDNLPTCKAENLTAAYRVVTEGAYKYFRTHDPEYAKHFKKCRDEWFKLYEL